MLTRTLGTMLATAMMLSMSGPVLAQNVNGSAGQMPAYYDDELFTINFKQLPPGGESSTLQHNKSINTIYMSDQFEAATSKMFISVLNAIQGDGFNPLWNEVQIVFPANGPFVQFTSDNAILAAEAMGRIMLLPTKEVYRCSVVGRK
jgi:hypothetical protein